MARTAFDFRAVGLVLLALAVSVSCAIDDRELQPTSAHAGAAGSNNAGNGNHAGSGARSGSGSTDTGGGTDSAGGDGGAGAADPGGSGASGNGGSAPAVDGCVDLNENGIADCNETLAKNAQFNAQTDDWAAEPTLEQAWAKDDAMGIDTSGAMALEATEVLTGVGSAMVGSRQCLPAEGDTTYVVGAQVYIDGATGDGRAGVNVWFYGSEGCVDNFIIGHDADTTFEPNTWRTVRGTVMAPTGTRSMSIRLVTVKPYEQATLRALFDNVLVVPQVADP